MNWCRDYTEAVLLPPAHSGWWLCAYDPVIAWSPLAAALYGLRWRVPPEYCPHENNDFFFTL